MKIPSSYYFYIVLLVDYGYNGRFLHKESDHNNRLSTFRSAEYSSTG